MIEVYRTDDGILSRFDSYTELKDIWINLVNPTADEIERIANFYRIDASDLTAALDRDESSRLSLEDSYNLLLIDIPSDEEKKLKHSYITFPLGIIMKDGVIITICDEETPIMTYFTQKNQKDLSTKKQLRFVYQILLKTAHIYQNDLRALDKKRIELENLAQKEISDSDLIKLHELESTLVYFETSLRANLAVVDRLRRYDKIKQYPEDNELLDDVETEYNQAIEMTTIFRGIVDGTRQLLSDIIDRRSNKAMKFLAGITVVMAIPTIISGLFGMNVTVSSIPFSSSPYGFAIICLLTALIAAIVLLILKKKKML